MNIQKICFSPINNANCPIVPNLTNKKSNYVQTPVQYANVPAGYRYNANISFTSTVAPKRRIVNIPVIEYENYKAMPNARKERFRILYRDFHKLLAESQMDILLKIDPHPEYMQLPLQTEHEMDEFIKVAQIYSKYKDHQIICLGRSPKWFLNASILMKDGIPDYKFVAFSGYWYRICDGIFGNNSGLVRLDSLAPTKTQEKAYKKYLKNIQADPLSIVKKAKETGKKVIITDYIDTGKGVTSFLDLMSRYAQEQGVLDEFGHSIELVTIGCNRYRRQRRNLEYVSEPSVWMPKLLEPYNRTTTAWGTGQIIQQHYYDIDYNVFKQMLLNQNTNECRSTYYPCPAWTEYMPNKFKTGMIKDMKKIKKKILALKSQKNAIAHFKPIMRAYRNLLHFRILDALNQRNLLKAIHHTKI